MSRWTTKAVAQELNTSRQVIVNICKKLGVEKHGHAYLITDDTLEEIRPHVHRRPGRPRKEAG